MNLTERVAMELAQIEAEDAARGDYRLSVVQTWAGQGEVLRDAWRRHATRIVNVVRREARGGA